MDLVRRLLAFSPFALLLLAAVEPRPLLAQYQKYEGMSITNIQFDPPDQPLEAAELHEILPVKMGQALHITDLPAGVALVPMPVEGFGHLTELDHEVAGQVLRIGLASFLAPEPDKCGFIGAHDDASVRAPNEAASTNGIT